MSELTSLLSTQLAARDENWEASLLKALPEARVRVLNPEPHVGPDGWPYLFVETVDGEKDGAESIAPILAWLSDRGIGLAVNPQKTSPDFVLSYGMIWNFRERGEFLSPGGHARSGAIEIKAGQEVLTGRPSEGYLPKYARAIIKQFLLDQGVFAPKILLVSFDRTNYDLCFSIESLKSPPAEEHAGIAEAISWFLPAHYVVSLISEKAIPGFESL